MKNNKKGFTIVELVVVIAVIAILAAVLIPTFSSITNSARESAALQEAKSGSETVLALTTGTLPENSAFIVADDEESDTNDYTFVFAGQKIQNVNAVEEFSDVLNMCKRNDVMTSGSATEGYIVYVSADAMTLDEEDQVTDVNAKIDTHVANRILAALEIAAPAEVGTNYNYTLASNRNYAMWTYSGITFNIYWTSDFNPTLIAFMGGNVAGESAETVETVEVTCNGATVDKTTVEKGKEADLVLTLPSAEEYAAYYTVTVGEYTVDVQPEEGKLNVTIPSQYTGSNFNITVEVATVTVSVEGATTETTTVKKGEAVTLELTVETPNARYSVTINGDGENAQTITAEGTTLEVSLTEDDTASAVTIKVIAA